MTITRLKRTISYPTKTCCIAQATLLKVMGSLDGRGDWEEKLGGEWIHVYVWPKPFAIHLKLSQNC